MSQIILATSKVWQQLQVKIFENQIEQLIVVNAAFNETKDSEKRKKNIIIFGLKESNKIVET